MNSSASILIPTKTEKSSVGLYENPVVEVNARFDDTSE